LDFGSTLSIERNDKSRHLKLVIVVRPINSVGTQKDARQCQNGLMRFPTSEEHRTICL
jgi:hypothetical protein